MNLFTQITDYSKIKKNSVIIIDINMYLSKVIIFQFSKTLNFNYKEFAKINVYNKKEYISRILV
jgi:hypothetical protein